MDKMQILSFVVDLFSENDSVLFICEGEGESVWGISRRFENELVIRCFLFSGIAIRCE